ncbi:MAG: UbiD family decarboxylase [Chloroflexi bacterium]|nr:UbiD family decarboxylase [Chloroflexota bacterium]
MPYYKDLREHVQALEASGKLVRIKREINKDLELHPLVRWQFRGLTEEQRKAFLFENVRDVKGRSYDTPVLVASHAASRQVYAIGMMCKPEEIMDRWANAELHPIEPVIVEKGPICEEIHKGSKLLEHGCLEEFPIPISTPGMDNAPYLTAANWVTKDPETGIRNVGNYRAMVKSPTRLGICALSTQHFREHWDRCRARGMALEAAIVLGASPNVGYVATAKLPYGVDEYAVAGGIAGAPLELVKCQTVNIEVPAYAEIVIEGIVPTDYQEREAPFGEYTGYMGMESINPVLNISCIMHRKSPIFNAFISQFPPSESSKLRQVAKEAVFYKFLKHDCNIPGIVDVGVHESGGANQYVVIAMRKSHPSQAWQALNGATALMPSAGKILIAVDDDIDPRDPDSVNWALSFRMQPHRDTKMTQGKVMGLDPSSAPLTDPDRRYPGVTGSSSLMIDATRKWAYPPTSLPKKEVMERARRIWEDEGLPKLTPKVPWYGYPLGHWTEENEEEARLAMTGEHYITGEKLAKKRITGEAGKRTGGGGGT